MSKKQQKPLSRDQIPGFKAVSPSNSTNDPDLASKALESILERPDFSPSVPPSRALPVANDPNRGGRPQQNMTPEEKIEAIKIAKTGATVKKIRDTLGIEPDFWYRSLERDPKFADDLAFARQIGLEELADGLQTIADEEPDVLRARLKSENTRWLLSKRKPSTYGDRIDMNINQVIDIGSALADARARALGIVDKNTIDIKVSEEDDLLS